MAKRYYIEYCVTLYHMDVFEADSIEEAREMRDNANWEWDKHLDDVFSSMDPVGSLDNMDYVDMGEVDWDWDGPVIGNKEFKSKYTSLED